MRSEVRRGRKFAEYHDDTQPEGTFTQEISGADVSYQDKAGKWNALDDSVWLAYNSAITANTPYTSGNHSNAWISKTGTTRYALLNSNDRANTAPTGYENLAIYGYGTATEAGDIVTAWLSAGLGGETYRVECKITTSKGRTDERSIWITVQER